MKSIAYLLMFLIVMMVIGSFAVAERPDILLVLNAGTNTLDIVKRGDRMVTVAQFDTMPRDLLYVAPLAYVTLPDENSVAIVDVKTGEVSRVSTGPGPKKMAFVDRVHGDRIYVTTDTEVTVIDVNDENGPPPNVVLENEKIDLTPFGGPGNPIACLGSYLAIGVWDRVVVFDVLDESAYFMDQVFFTGSYVRDLLYPGGRDNYNSSLYVALAYPIAAHHFGQYLGTGRLHILHVPTYVFTKKVLEPAGNELIAFAKESAREDETYVYGTALGEIYAIQENVPETGEDDVQVMHMHLKALMWDIALSSESAYVANPLTGEIHVIARGVTPAEDRYERSIQLEAPARPISIEILEKSSFKRHRSSRSR